MKLFQVCQAGLLRVAVSLRLTASPTHSDSVTVANQCVRAGLSLSHGPVGPVSARFPMPGNFEAVKHQVEVHLTRPGSRCCGPLAGLGKSLRPRPGLQLSWWCRPAASCQQLPPSESIMTDSRESIKTARAAPRCQCHPLAAGPPPPSRRLTGPGPGPPRQGWTRRDKSGLGPGRTRKRRPGGSRGALAASVICPFQCPAGASRESVPARHG